MSRTARLLPDLCSWTQVLQNSITPHAPDDQPLSGMIISPAQADHIVRTGQADMVLLAQELHQPTSWPKQYLRSGPKNATPRTPLD
jgi:hypothetical protein